MKDAEETEEQDIRSPRTSCARSGLIGARAGLARGVSMVTLTLTNGQVRVCRAALAGLSMEVERATTGELNIAIDVLGDSPRLAGEGDDSVRARLQMLVGTALDDDGRELPAASELATEEPDAA